MSRGDKSGTHIAELELWKARGVDLEKAKGPWYRDTGQGMGPALNTAASMNAYLLADRGTWLAFKNRGDLTILVEGDKRLFNQYGVMLVNPDKHPNVKKDLGQIFVDWVVSPEGQKAIADYKINGEQLFFPNAGQARRMTSRAILFAMTLTSSTIATGQEAAVRLYAAGSLRAAMTEIAQAFAATGGPVVNATFGASGLLRERIEKGESADVFASADMGNPQALARAGRAAAPVVFARNRLCALVAPGVEASPDTLLDRILDPQVKLGTSTPKADPSGDYAWLLFEKADKQRPGAYKIARCEGVEADRRTRFAAASCRPFGVRR